MVVRETLGGIRKNALRIGCAYRWQSMKLVEYSRRLGELRLFDDQAIDK